LLLLLLWCWLSILLAVLDLRVGRLLLLLSVGRRLTVQRGLIRHPSSLLLLLLQEGHLLLVLHKLSIVQQHRRSHIGLLPSIRRFSPCHSFRQQFLHVRFVLGLRSQSCPSLAPHAHAHDDRDDQCDEHHTADDNGGNDATRQLTRAIERTRRRSATVVLSTSIRALASR
jgi:hypothetical protein